MCGGRYLAVGIIYTTTQYSTVQYSTVKHSTVQLGAPYLGGVLALTAGRVAARVVQPGTIIQPTVMLAALLHIP